MDFTANSAVIDLGENVVTRLSDQNVAINQQETVHIYAHATEANSRVYNIILKNHKAHIIIHNLRYQVNLIICFLYNYFFVINCFRTLTIMLNLSSTRK